MQQLLNTCCTLQHSLPFCASSNSRGNRYRHLSAATLDSMLAAAAAAALGSSTCQRHLAAALGSSSSTWQQHLAALGGGSSSSTCHQQHQQQHIIATIMAPTCGSSPYAPCTSTSSWHQQLQQQVCPVHTGCTARFAVCCHHLLCAQGQRQHVAQPAGCSANQVARKPHSPQGQPGACGPDPNPKLRLTLTCGYP
jgi:hypothetical protein